MECLTYKQLDRGENFNARDACESRNCSRVDIKADGTGESDNDL